jgi:hypothetical protein
MVDSKLGPTRRQQKLLYVRMVDADGDQKGTGVLQRYCHRSTGLYLDVLVGLNIPRHHHGCRVEARVLTI